MSNFKTRILGLAAVATAFVGVSYGQTVSCTTAPQADPALRQEGQTELLAPLVATCTGNGVATTGTVYITTSLPITSKAFTAAGVTSNEAALQVNGGAVIQGTVSGSTVTFANVPLTGGADQLKVMNIRVNASAATNPQVTESGVLVYTTTAAGGTASATIPPSATGGPGYVLKSLSGPTLNTTGVFSPVQSYYLCQGNNAANANNSTAAFTFNINTAIGGALKNQTDEQGQYVSGANIGTASTGDQIVVTFANVPTGVTLYVPATITSTQGGNNPTTLTIANNPTVVGTGANIANDVAYTSTNGTVTVTYVTLSDPAAGPLTIPVSVYVGFAANAGITANGPITVNYSYGPAVAPLTGPAPSVPLFVASSFTAANGTTFNSCATNLLFPFVTNTLGFDTGIVIANTSSDNLATSKALQTNFPSSVTPQGGTCTLSFYGTGLPATSTGVTDPLGNLATAGTHAFTLSSVAPGFQGYMIASCPFLYAHGFAYIAYNLTQNNGTAMGYLAEVLNRGLANAPQVEAVTF
jgi:hypothetical protein